MTAAETQGPLVIDIVDLPPTLGATKDFARDLAAPADLGTEVIGVPEGAPISIEGSVSSMEDGVFVSAQAHLPIHGECVRCLRDIDEERDIRVDDMFFFPEVAKAQAEEGDEEAEDFYLVGERSLDLETALRDTLVLQLPFQPLCQPNCKGLCPDCGERLDDLPADHHHEKLDPRWSVLAGLMESQEQE